MKQNNPNQTPKKDLMEAALQHYEEASHAVMCYYSDIPKAIKQYYAEDVDDPNEKIKVCSNGASPLVDALEEIFKSYRMSKEHHIALGDIRLTMTDQENILQSLTSQPQPMSNEEIERIGRLKYANFPNPTDADVQAAYVYSEGMREYRDRTKG